jgi:hypothetical protein
MVYSNPIKNFGRRRGPGGFVPGARVNNTTQEMGSLPSIFIGEHGGSGVSQMNDVRGYASRRPMVQDLPGRRIDTSHRAGEMDSRMSAVLEARRTQRLAAADAGLSGRGLKNAPGRGARPVRGGLERRGTIPGAGERAMGRAPKVRNAPVEANGYGSLVGRRDAAMAARNSSGARDSAVASARRHNASMNRGRVTGTAGEGRGVKPFAYGNGAHPGRPAAAGSGGLPGDINLGTRGQVNHNPFNTLAARAEGNNVERATAAIGNKKGIRPFPYGNGAHAGRPGPAGAGGLPKDINLGTRSQVNHNPFNTFGGATHVSPKAIGEGGTQVIEDSVKGAKAIEEAAGKGASLFHGQGLAIGLGAAVIGGLALAHRRKATSSGRTSMRNY